MSKTYKVNLHITDTCNCSCRHCFAHFSESKPLSVDDWKRVVDNCISETKVTEFNIAGGEPLLYPALIDLVQYIRDKGIDVSIITNGILMTTEWVKKNASLFKTIGFSIDSFSENTNRELGRMTQNGQWLTRVKFYSLCYAIRRYAPETAIKVNTVVNKLNKDENLGQWILDDKQVRISRWKIMRMKVFDNGKFSNINLQVSTNDYNRFVRWNSGIESVPQVTNNGNSLVIQSTADCSIIVEPELRKSYLIVDSTGYLLDNSHGGNYLQVCDLKSSPLRKGIDALEASLAFDYQRYASRYSSPEVRIYAKQA